MKEEVKITTELDYCKRNAVQLFNNSGEVLY